jgi:hypothetical protein
MRLLCDLRFVILIGVRRITQGNEQCLHPTIEKPKDLKRGPAHETKHEQTTDQAGDDFWEAPHGSIGRPEPQVYTP